MLENKKRSLLIFLFDDLRAKFAVGKTKSYSKSFENLKQAVFMWIHRDLLIENRIRYSSYYGKSRNMGQ